MKPLISIIIPTYNRAHIIGETLDSILAQTYTNWECIIVDDGSTDDNEKIIKEYIKKDTRFKFYKRPNDKLKGPNSCRNFGFDKAKGNLIQWFDSDDLLVQNAFEIYVKAFGKSLNADVVVAKLELIHLNSNLAIKINSIKSTNLIEDYFTGKVVFYVCGPIWTREFLLKQKELFSEDVTNLDDWDFNLRMLYNNPKIIFLDEVLIQYRIHANSLSQEVEKLNIKEIKSEFMAREKHVKLLHENKLVDSLILNLFIRDRYKFLLREALVKKNVLKYYLFKKTIQKQLQLFDIKGVFKSIFGFCIYSMFNQGYKFLK